MDSHSHSVPEFPAPLKSCVYIIAEFVICQESFCRSSSTVNGRSPIVTCSARLRAAADTSSTLPEWASQWMWARFFKMCESLCEVSHRDQGRLMMGNQFEARQGRESETKGRRSENAEDWHYILWQTINFIYCRNIRGGGTFGMEQWNKVGFWFANKKVSHTDCWSKGGGRRQSDHICLQ